MATGSQASDPSSSLTAAGLPFPLQNPTAAPFSYDQLAMEQFAYDSASNLGLDMAAGGVGYDVQAQDDFNASSSLAMPPPGLGELALDGLAIDLGGDLDWNDMMESWAGVVDDEWKQGSVSAAWLANEIEKGAGAIQQQQQSSQLLHDIQIPNPSIPILAYSSSDATPSASSSTNGSFPSTFSQSSSSSSNDHGSPFAQYSSSLRSFATAILSSLPKIAIPAPKLPSTLKTPAVAFVAYPPPSKVEAAPISPTQATIPLTIIERRTAKKEEQEKAKLMLVEAEQKQAGWFTLQVKGAGVAA